MFLLMIVVLIGGMIVGLPVAFALILASVSALVINGIPLDAFVQNISLGVNSFPLLAVPFFILAGQLMNSGGITNRVFRFANHLVGPIRGGLGQVNILSSLIFAGMSGAAIADASGLGVVEIKAMRDAGYDNDFSVAITSASSTVGPIIPPSIAMVVYGMAAEVSVGRLFIGGIIPGVLMTVALMLLTYLIATKRKYPTEPRVSLHIFVRDTISALPALMTPLIIVGGILGGVFTATEAGAVAVLWALIVGLLIYREMTPKDLARILLEAMLTTAKILFIVGGAAVFGWVLTYFNIPARFAAFMSGITSNPTLTILLFIVLYLLLGCFMEAGAVIVMTVPVVMPLLNQIGIDPIFFGVLMTMCLSIGTLTPPLGTVMYVMCNIGEISVERFIRIILPFLAVLIAVVLLVGFFPSLVTVLPRLLMD
jgi:tripartite ATP-independent transporter DctM subunit